MNAFFVYILKSLKDSKYYIGCTENLERRINDHNRGKSISVRNRGPFELIYQERYESRSDALKREKQIKRYKGGEAFKNLVLRNAFDPIV